MKLRVKSNGNVVEMKKEKFDALPADHKLSYEIVDKADATPKKDVVVKNETKKTEAPATGDSGNNGPGNTKP